MSMDRIVVCDALRCGEFLSSPWDAVAETGSLVGVIANAGWQTVTLPRSGPGRDSVDIHLCDRHARKGVPLDALDDARLLMEWHA